MPIKPILSLLLILHLLILCHSTNNNVNTSPFENIAVNIYVTPQEKATDLCFVMNFYGSDKGHPLHSSAHSYTNYYSPLFNNFRYITSSSKNTSNYPLRILELGLGTNNTKLKSNMGANGKPGASLRGWEYYFENSEIYGADVDKQILFKSGRIQTFYCDQTNQSSIKSMWEENEELSKEKFNIIIEDGLHKFEANVVFFENSIDHLAINGIFIIEDIIVHSFGKWKKQVVTWSKKYPNFEFHKVEFPYYTKTNHFDNNLIVAHRIS